ncbi:Uncharacterized protein BP5553_08585 [Venustampulla echinocandica]|uniref:Protein phosphatase 4 core regulatory subunit R2 n=1 Tax=Venustampulla echinocandica TaxID=2656787 RepID=A0A370TEN6_9HELO|nr:Uncharacterized protein BP5553_08585 [Venustampulla echinocandica]RDL33146.1 Uncharacterized protein BP5553_08585 [Venustampulla echinocandica]
MDLDTDDEILRTLADGKSMDYELWPGLLSRLIPRLHKIVQTEFPSPSSPPPQQPAAQSISSSPPIQTINPDPSSQNSGSSTQSTDKENAPPPGVQSPSASLPTQVQTLLTSITSTLESLFSKYPPHTVQRLAELILYPRQHYRILSSYLHAVDRTVHVTSGAHIFPLPAAIPDPSSAAVLSNGTTDPLTITWGNPATISQSALGSDESLGGALLTPIPWLSKNSSNGSNGGSHSPEVKTESTEMIEGPNGPGGIETVSVSVNGISSATASVASSSSDGNDGTAALRAEGGVTQGELLRQEQRAGVVPASQLAGTKGDSDGMGEEDEVPHARGPEEIGMEDMGPQSGPTPGVNMQGINVEAAVGRKAESNENEDEEMKEGDEEAAAPGTPKREAEEDIGPAEKRVKEAAGEGGEGDIAVGDPSASNTEGEEKKPE